MALDAEQGLTAVGSIIAVILTKLGWDKVQSQRRGGPEDEPRVDDMLKARETVLMHVANRIHAVRDDIHPKLTDLYTKGAVVDLKLARQEADNLETKRALADAVKGFNDGMQRIHDHIDRRQDKLELKFDEFIERRRGGAA